jgi:hypothetical protein
VRASKIGRKRIGRRLHAAHESQNESLMSR